jgi:hypothetical protein
MLVEPMFSQLVLLTTCLVTVMVCLALSYVILQPAPLFEFFTSCKHNTSACFLPMRRRTPDRSKRYLNYDNN